MASKVVGDLGELLALPADLDAAWVDRMDGGGGGDGTGEDGDVVAGDDFVVEEEAPGFHKEEEAPAALAHNVEGDVDDVVGDDAAAAVPELAPMAALGADDGRIAGEAAPDVDDGIDDTFGALVAEFLAMDAWANCSCRRYNYSPGLPSNSVVA